MPKEHELFPIAHFLLQATDPERHVKGGFPGLALNYLWCCAKLILASMESQSLEKKTIIALIQSFPQYILKGEESSELPDISIIVSASIVDDKMHIGYGGISTIFYKPPRNNDLQPNPNLVTKAKLFADALAAIQKNLLSNDQAVALIPSSTGSYRYSEVSQLNALTGRNVNNTASEITEKSEEKQPVALTHGSP